MADGTGNRRRRAQQPPLVVFIHIPKTAGTTLTTVLNVNEPGERTRRAGNVFRGGGGTKEGAQFAALRENEWSGLRNVRILTGHFPLGIREHLPSDRDIRYFTFLREPTDRTLSHYFQIRDKHEGSPESASEEFGLSPLPPDPTLSDALEGGYLHDNLHTRMLSGLAEPFGKVTDEMLEQAKHNLREELVYFGLTERFDESLVLAKRRLGLRSILYRSAGTSGGRSRVRSSGRVNSARPRGDEVPAELVEAAQRANRYDIELYRYAQELFDSAPERAELDFKVELAAFDAAMVDGEIEVEAPPPASFGGDEEAWRMLLHARAALLRDEQELAEILGLTWELGQRDPEVLEKFGRLQAKRERRVGPEADTAKVAMQMLARAHARVFDDVESERKPGNAKTGRSRPASTPAPAGGAKSRRRTRANRTASRQKTARPKPRTRQRNTAKGSPDPPDRPSNHDA